LKHGRRTSLAHGVLTTWRRLPLHGLAYRFLRLAPQRVQRWAQVRKEQLRVSAGQRLVPEAALEAKFREALIFLAETRGPDALGDYLEFGVYHGASMACMHRALKGLGFDRVRLFGFDSFEGLPGAATEPESGGSWIPGQYAIGEEFARQFLTSADIDWSRVTLVKGWFSDTLNEPLIRDHAIAKASVIMVDCDLYSSAREVLDFCVPLIRDEAILFFDDWQGSTSFDVQERLGEKQAFKELLEKHGDLAAAPFGSYLHSEMENPTNGEIFRIWRTNT
jgi:O-methyltransferase